MVTGLVVGFSLVSKKTFSMFGPALEHGITSNNSSYNCYFSAWTGNQGPVEFHIPSKSQLSYRWKAIGQKWFRKMSGHASWQIPSKLHAGICICICRAFRIWCWSEKLKVSLTVVLLSINLAHLTYSCRVFFGFCVLNQSWRIWFLWFCGKY